MVAILVSSARCFFYLLIIVGLHRFRLSMGKFYNSERPPNKKYGVQRSGIQKRSYNSSYGGSGRNAPMDRKSKFNMSEEDLPVPDWDSVSLKPFKKDFYVPHDNILKR